VRVLLGQGEFDLDAHRSRAVADRDGLTGSDGVPDAHRVATRSYAAHRSYGAPRTVGYRLSAGR